MDPNSTPLISIALCTYNGAQYLPEQLSSLMQQSWPHLEIVAVDDGSTDGTRELLQAAAAQDPRLRVYFNEENLGFKRNFEKAFSLCKGQLIAPCDQDDVWHPEKLQRLHAILGQHALVYCDSTLIDSQGVDLGERASDFINMYQGSDPAAFVFWNCVSGHALLCRRDVLERAMPMPAVIYHDWWVAFVAASLGGISYLDMPLVQYRQHAGSQTDLRGARRNARVLDRTQPFAEKAVWLETLARLESPHQSWFRELHRLWCACAAQWLAPQLVLHLAQRRKSLTFINQDKHFFHVAIKYIWGLQAKAAFNPRRYSSKNMERLMREFGRDT